MNGALIRTPDQRLRVFVSSTLAELAEERAAVRESVERLLLAPVMFELGARPYPPRELYRAYLEQSQIFVGVYWQSYGWVAPGETVSGLEDEYSLSQGIPRLLYVEKPAPQRELRLEQLLRRVQDDDTASYKPFRTPDELARLVGADLALLLSERFASPGTPTGVVTFLVTDVAGGSAGWASATDDIIPVPPLGVPPQGTDVTALVGFPAGRLFTDRAKAVRPQFAVTPANAAAVARIVTRLDGIPRALELAAARVKVLSVEQITARLSHRFRLLSGGARTALPRQQTPRAAMDRSYDLLAPAEQTLLRRLSVFMGNWTVEAAETVCSGDGVDAPDVLDLLGGLVDKSLVTVVEGTEENRYRLLETVRQYGREHLVDAGQSAVTRTAHRDWCRSTVEAAAHHVRGGEEQARWLERLETEHDNVQAALEWSFSLGDATASLRIAVGAAWFWYLHGHWDEARRWLEPRRWLEQSIAPHGAEPALRAKGGAWAAVLAWRRGDLPPAAEPAEASLERLAGSGDEGEGLGLLALALVATSRSQLEQADPHGRRALGVFRAQQHAWGVTTSLLVLAHVAINRRSGEVTALLQESAALLTSGTDKWGQAHVLTLQGNEAVRGLDLDLAKVLHYASHALAVELGDRAGQAENLLALGHVHLLRGEDEDAARALEETRSVVEQLRDPHDLAHADQALALLTVSRGDVADGEALLDDVSRRLLEMGRAPMGSAYAIGMADIYRRGGRPTLATVLLRHSLTLLDESQSPAEYARASQDLAALQGATADAGGGPP